MDILVNVANQRLKVATNQKTFVAGTQEFIRFVFELSNDWTNLTTFVQFQQNDKSYNVYLDEENAAYLPPEIVSGTLTIALQGNLRRTIAKSQALTFAVDVDPIKSDSSGTEITLSLYDQLAGSIAGIEDDMAKLDERMMALEQDEVVLAEIRAATEDVLAEYLANDEFAAMTIGDGTIGREKIDADFEEALRTIEDTLSVAMMPEIYDPRGLEQDIFAYAKAKADEVDGYLDAYEKSNNAQVGSIIDEIRAAYVVDGITYKNLNEAINGAVTTANNYSVALLADYKAFTIEIVDELPTIGVAQTFYLIPNESGTGYDKYWWIIDEEGKAKWDGFGSSSTLVVDELPAVGEVDVDYILNSSAGCLYYKWIDGEWCIVAGSIAKVLEELPPEGSGNEFTDYYVANGDGTYAHYRYISGAFVQVGKDSYTKEEVDSIVTRINNNYSELEGRLSAAEANISSVSQTVDTLRQTIDNLDVEGYTYYTTYDTDGVFQLIEVKDGEETVKSQHIIKGGGGGGDATVTNLSVERITQSPLIITATDPTIIDILFSCTDADGEVIDATYTWKAGNTVLLTGTLVQGTNSFDLSAYTTIGTQKFTLTVVDEVGNRAVKSWTVQKVDVRIESSFSDRYTTAIDRSVSFTYTPYGAVSKVVHFKLDGVEETVSTSASGTLQSYPIAPQSHGSHLLEAWITATINNTEVETEHIFRDIIWYDETSEDAVIGCIYRSDYYSEARDDNEKEPGKVYVRQYDTTPIVYHVFDPTTNFPVVSRYVDGELVGTNTVTESQNVWNFQTDKVGIHTLKIVVRDTEVTIIVNVTELGIDVSPITGGLEIDFNPTGTTNSSDDRIWSNGKYAMSVSENFDWANGGYQTDENGDTYFLVKAGTKVWFDYLMFSGGLDGNPSVLGSEMKLIFMTENVQDKDAVWFSNVETTTTEVEGVTQTTNVGIQMGVHEGWLKTNNASDTDVEGEGGADSVSATNTYLYMPYSEEDIIEIDINIDTINRDDPTAKAFVMAYEDGVPSKAYVYDSGDRFYQYNPQPIEIGSDYCDVRIYRMKIYSASLTTENIMKNFIADSRNSTTMLARYDRNSIYYNRETNTYTPYSGEGVIDPEKLAPIVPNVKILMLETDHFTTSKKTFVKSKFRCIHAPGGNLFEGDAYHDNWLFENGWHSGQGTTSDNYGNASRNVDFLFNCDGTHKPSDKVAAESDYISKVTLGYGTENARTESVTDWKGDTGKVALTRTSIPNNFFNLKVNVASSENVNNMLLQKRYNDFLPYISPAKKRNPNTKCVMEFVPAILFIKETNPDISTHNEFLDTEWHFYSLGNIGDSKKTDYTRAYDPEDMNEFTLEISDNTKNNATFQSGVYLDNDGNRQIEKFTITESEDDGDIILTPVSTDKPQSFVYPITQEEWEDENNMRHWCIYNEGFDGDHSFEARYACCGDYRDGKLVNDTSGRGKAQMKLNEEVWRAFYRWVITSTDEQFVAELDQWCVRSAVEFFYAFTHMYTMMDNRAKNTFWHFAKTGEYREVSRPVPELLHIYCEYIDNEYVTTTDTEIDPGKTYYTQYAFDMHDYDNDTALGINNNGELIFPYGKEDTDYNIEDNPSSGYVFNGATSVFWCRLRDLLSSEITSTFQNVASECFSATNLINQFDSYQECFPEEIWRLDVQRKYIRTFTGESIDNSKPKHDVQYLRDMMQGRKKYQRRQWVRDQEIYFGTMNLMNTVVGDDNRITFRCFTPTGSDVVVAPDYTLRMTPYSDMYLSVMFGNGGVQQIRAKAGVEYTIECPLSSMDDTQVTIYGANRIQALNDLSACYIAANNFSMASKLRKLVIGNTTTGYNNSRLVSLTLGNNKLLEELDIRNCGNLTGAINLAQCSNLLKLYAEGTKLTGVTFATNGKVQVAHLPNTINTLTMRNLNNLVDFQATLGQLETLTLQGGTLNSLDVVTDCIDTLQVLYLYDIDWDVADTELLNKIALLFYSLLTGEVYISGQVRNQELFTYDTKWNDLEVTYDSSNLVTQHLITYVNANGDVLYEHYVDQGSVPPDPVVEGYIETPTMESTAQYDFTYTGWDDVKTIALAPRTITALYSNTVRKYTVTWYSRAGLSLGSVEAEYGSDVTYSGEIPTNTSQESTFVYNIFAGWDKSTGYITGDIDVYARWERAELPYVGKQLKNMTDAEIYAVAASNKAADYFESKDYKDITLGRDFDFDNVEGRVLAENRYFDGETAFDTGIKLFGSEEKSFTIAIDYQFTSTEANNTLVSCFEEDGSEGFRLRYNSNPNIQWGSINQNVGYKAKRDIVVLRHIKGDDKLYVYASSRPISASDTAFDDEVMHEVIARNRLSDTEATLVFGAVKFLEDGGYDYYGKGFIHWCKIWFDDLGDANARALASWYHEPLRMEFCGANRYRIAGGGSKSCGASFIANNLLLDRGHCMNPTNTNVGGWNSCAMRPFLNGKFLSALPITWQAMLKTVKINASAGNQSHEIIISEDKVYLAANREVGGYTTSPYVDEGTIIDFFTSNASRIKFRGRIIPEDVTFYTSATEPSEISTNDVTEGDIWINTSKDSIGYMYVSQDEIDKYNLTPFATAKIGGGWISASNWWERSPYVGNTTYFMIVYGNGGPGSYGASNAYGVCPCFSI